MADCSSANNSGRNEELTVLDPFLGIGNALVAAKRCCVREFVGVELDEEYLKVARERMAG